MRVLICDLALRLSLRASDGGVTMRLMFEVLMRMRMLWEYQSSLSLDDPS